MSTLLTVSMMLSQVSAVMAEEIVWKMPNYSSFIAPRNGNTVVYDASLESGATGEFPYQLTVDGALVQNVSGISYTSDGTISVGSDFEEFKQYKFRTKIGGAYKQVSYYFYPNVDIEFQDYTVGTRLEGGVSSIFTTKSHNIKEENGLHYAAYNDNSYIMIKPSGCSSEGKFVVEAMIRDGGYGFGLTFTDETKVNINDELKDILNKATDGWHNYRIIYDMDNLTRTIFCDDMLLEQNTALSWEANPSPVKLTQIQSYFDMASFKLYSVPAGDSWVYDITTDVAPRVGETVTPSASVLDNGGNAEVASYVYQISDNKYSNYVTVGVGPSITIDEGYAGKYFRIGAYSEDLVTGYIGEEVFSEPVKLAPKLQWVQNGGEPYFLAPMEGEVFQYQIKAEGPENIKYSLDRVIQGVSITPDGLLTVLPTANGHGNVKATDSSDSSNAITHHLYFNQGKNIDFEDNEVGGKNNHFEYGEVKEDETGNKYITNGQGKDYARFKTESSANYDLRNMKSTYAIDFDMYVKENIMKNAYLYFDNKPEASISVIGQFTLNEFYDASTDNYRLPVKLDEGWHNIRIYVDTDLKTYSIIADEDIILSSNEKLLNLEEGDSALLTRMDFYASIDNLKIRNITVKTPVIENVTVDNPAVGKELKVKYDFNCGTVQDKCTATKWYISDNYADGYTLVSEESTYAPTVEQLGKYVKAVVTPATENAWGDTLTGVAVESKPKKIVALAVGEFTGDLSGNVIDLTKKNIKSAVALNGTLTINAPVTNNGAEDKNVLVVTAVYSKNTLVNVGVDTAEVKTGETKDLSLYMTFEEYMVTDADKIKIFVFDRDSLTPIKDATYIR